MSFHYYLKATGYTIEGSIVDLNLCLPRNQEAPQIYDLLQSFHRSHCAADFDTIDELLAALKTIEKYKDRQFFLIHSEVGPFGSTAKPHYKIFSQSQWEGDRHDELIDTKMIIEIWGSKED